MTFKARGDAVAGLSPARPPRKVSLSNMKKTRIKVPEERTTVLATKVIPSWVVTPVILAILYMEGFGGSLEDMKIGSVFK